MASGLSGTYQTAMMAKDSCDNPDLVHVVDSQTLCGPHRLMVDTALEMANNGASAKDIVKMIVQSRMQEESYLVSILSSWWKNQRVSCYIGWCIKIDSNFEKRR